MQNENANDKKSESKYTSGGSSKVSEAIDLEEWEDAVHRLQAELNSSERRRRFRQAMSIIAAGLEAAIAKEPKRLRSGPPASKVNLDWLMGQLMESLVVRGGTATTDGVLKLIEKIEELPPEKKRYLDEMERDGNTGMFHAEGSTVPTYVAFDAPALCIDAEDFFECWDNGCLRLGNTMCVHAIGLLAELVGIDCVCMKRPDWWDLALVALFIALVLTPIPGDEVIASGALLARLLRLIVRAATAAAVAAA